MKYVLDTELFLEYNLTDEEVYYLMALTSNCSLERAEQTLLEKGYITRNGSEDNELVATDAGIERLHSVLLNSDSYVPKKDRCSELANKLRELFPKGLKVGSAAWRGNNREITLRLQKFFKLYGNKWTDEEIINAATKYVESFNGNYTYMRILKYFIMKSEVKYDEEGTGHIEDVSELANWLENDTTNTEIDWLSEMR